ncbi:hypothetical protein [Anaerosporobacter faecicola]|uniref:hypothetical protein n=1 Tax=Anaerosporobacter faecicola TaxID=2718714 RepID=UPI00143C46F7|nr:hypothetical protein [Anaerosporobacter faecicola]
MIEEDSLHLLDECDAGLKMAIKSIDEVVDHAQNNDLKDSLEKSRKEHITLQTELDQLLQRYHDDGKEPNPVATAMSWLKTNMKLMTDNADPKIADLMTDGCNMGIKSVCKYLNQYPAASEEVKALARKIVHIEEDFMIDLRRFL